MGNSDEACNIRCRPDDFCGGVWRPSVIAARVIDIVGARTGSLATVLSSMAEALWGKSTQTSKIATSRKTPAIIRVLKKNKREEEIEDVNKPIFLNCYVGMYESEIYFMRG